MEAVPVTICMLKGVVEAEVSEEAEERGVEGWVGERGLGVGRFEGHMFQC